MSSLITLWKLYSTFRIATIIVSAFILTTGTTLAVSQNNQILSTGRNIQIFAEKIPTLQSTTNPTRISNMALVTKPEDSIHKITLGTVNGADSTTGIVRSFRNTAGIRANYGTAYNSLLLIELTSRAILEGEHTVTSTTVNDFSTKTDVSNKKDTEFRWIGINQ